MEAVDTYLVEQDYQNLLAEESYMEMQVETMLDEFEIDEDWATANGYRNFQMDVAVYGYEDLA